MRFTLTTIGCKVNQYDGSAIAGALQRAGLEPTNDARCADLVVVNTCCVTVAAMRKSRQAIGRVVRAADRPAVLVAGCYSDYDGRRIAELLAGLNVEPGKTVIVGHHGDLPAALRRVLAVVGPRRAPARPSAPPSPPGPDEGPVSDAASRPANWHLASPASIRARRDRTVKRNVPAADLGPIERFPDHQRAFVKVQDGCDAFCTYCIVPFTRPRVWSRPMDQVQEECRRLIAAGHREIVLCGVFLGAYGQRTAQRRRWDRTPAALPQLLRRIASLDGLWRVRFSSLEPADVTDELLAVCRQTPLLAPHFHLPLQSGSDRILRRMNRQYAAEDFRRTVARLRQAFDRPAITTDIIVGFPGESDADFAETLRLAREAEFAKIHAFPFSPIDGTAAYKWRADRPSAQAVKERMAALGKLERRLAADFRKCFAGQMLEGLVESHRSGGNPVRQAMSDRYLKVFFRPTDHQDPTGRVGRFEIAGLHPEGLTGRLVELVM